MGDRRGKRAREEFLVWSEAIYARLLVALADRDRLADALEPLQARSAAAAARLAAFDGAGGPMATIAYRLGLTRDQLQFLWTSAVFAGEPRLAVHAEALGGSSARRGLTIGLYTGVLDIDDEVARDLAIWLAGPNPLIEYGLLAASDEAATATSRPYHVPARFLAHLRGHRWTDPDLRLVTATAEEIVHDEPQHAILEQLTRSLSADAGDVVVILEGPVGSGRSTAVALACGRPVIALDCARVERSRIDGALRALRREALLEHSTALIADADRLHRDSTADDALPRFVDRHVGPLVITSSLPGLDLGARRSVLRIRWPVPEVEGRRRLWARLASISATPPSGDLELLASRYRVGPGTIERAVATARTLTPAAGHPLDADVLGKGLRHNIAERLGGLATRVEVNQTWDDLIVADETRDQISALIARVRFAPQVMERWGYRGKMARGTGVPALFSGPPGTGKSMSAGLIARELDLELYQVDLSQVVSKWVGETEKQLARVFDAAEEGHALLLFDEADALFGQRSAEVKGAVDRYANLEVNFLLQRIESFGGMAILTTNMDTSIDRALRRRLAAHIVFDAPDEDERAELWRRLTRTSQAPLDDDIDVERLASEFPNTTGANIRNAALAAAFLAAADGAERISQEHLHRAVRAEYRAMGHVLADRGRGAPRGL